MTCTHEKQLKALKYKPLECPWCATEKFVMHHGSASGLNKSQTLETWLVTKDTGYFTKEEKNLVAIANEIPIWAHLLDTNTSIVLYILGESGIGKTHIVNAIGHIMAEKYAVVYVDLQQLTTLAYEAAATRRRSEYYDWLNRIKNATVLILDSPEALTATDKVVGTAIAELSSRVTNIAVNGRIVVASKIPIAASPIKDTLLKARVVKVKNINIGRWHV